MTPYADRRAVIAQGASRATGDRTARKVVVRYGMLGKLVCWLAMTVLLAGCAASLPPLPPPVMQTSLPQALTQRQQLMDAAATVGPDDVLRVTVFNQPDLSREVTVASDGTFTYPPLGTIHATGLTVRELEQQLMQRFADGYLVNPQLAVAVVQRRSRHVSILGAVQKPGVYPLQHGATLLEIISLAGGPAPTAGQYVLLSRAAGEAAGGTSDSQENSAVLRIDLDRLLAGELTSPVRVTNGDTIYVQPGGYIFVTGQVEKPGQYPLGRDTTVQKAITLAGGFSEYAAKNRLQVKRVIDGEPQKFRASLDDRLQAEDVLVVPESLF
jgi:polysaccharide export outer membrane protein